MTLTPQIFRDNPHVTLVPLYTIVFRDLMIVLATPIVVQLIRLLGLADPFQSFWRMRII